MHFFLSMAVKKPLLPKKTVPFFVTHRIIRCRLIELGGQLKYQSVQYKNHSKVYSVNVEGCKYLQQFSFAILVSLILLFLFLSNI